MSVLRNKCSPLLVNYVKHHTQEQLVRTQTTAFLQGEDTEGTKHVQGCTWTVPSLPAQHILVSLHVPSASVSRSAGYYVSFPNP